MKCRDFAGLRCHHDAILTRCRYPRAASRLRGGGGGAVCAAVDVLASERRCSMAGKKRKSPSAAVVAAAAGAADVEVLHSDVVMPPGLPFSDGVRVGNLVILSGQLGIRPGTMQLVEGGMEAQARQTLDNIARVLAAHGLTLRDVVRVQ